MNNIYELKDFWKIPFINTLITLSENENYNLKYIEVVELLYNNGQINNKIYEEFKKQNCKTFACLYAIQHKAKSDIINNNNCSFEKPKGPIGQCCFCPLKVINIFPNNCLNGFFDEIEYYSELLKQNNLSNIKISKYKRYRFDLLELVKKIPYSDYYLNDSTPISGF